ncbi:MAG: bifunctional heptose 7-phosphate kinase/heptose 1-phosphate adenyltransferase, partial [Gemmatimonadota bacterium]
AALRDRALEALAGTHVLVLEDYDKGTITPALARSLLEEAGRRGVPSIVDPKLRHFFDFQGADIFKPNGAEVAVALGREAPPEDAAALRGLARRVGCRHLVVTLGERGLWLLAEGASEVQRIPSRAREVYDVSGAGDTVTAVLAVGLATGAALPDSASLANFAAGLGVARSGARPVSCRALRERLSYVAGPETRPARE